MNPKYKTKLITGIVFLLLVFVGASASFFLSQQNQDLRQQADDSVGAYNCDGVWDGNNCVSTDSDRNSERETENLVGREPSSEELEEGIIETSFDGIRPTNEGSCGSVWMNSFCYMPGDEFEGGLVVVESGRHDYPYFEKKEVLEGISYGAESVSSGKIGTSSSLGSDCGGKGLDIDGICYAYGSNVNGYLVMPDGSGLKEIETRYEDWEKAVSEYENSGDLSALEALYQNTYGISFSEGNLYDSSAVNADVLRAESLLLALTNSDVLQAEAKKDNEALKKELEERGDLSEEDRERKQAEIDFNQKLIDDPNLNTRYQTLDWVTSSTVKSTTLNRSYNEFVEALGQASDEELEKVAEEKFEQVFGYDPSKKYGDYKGVLKALNIDPKLMEDIREDFQESEELRKQNENLEKINFSNLSEREKRDDRFDRENLLKTVASNYASGILSRDEVLDKIGISSRYVGGMSMEQLFNGVYREMGLSDDVAQDYAKKVVSSRKEADLFQNYLKTRDINYLKESANNNKSLAEITSGGISNDPEVLLKDIYGGEVGERVYQDYVLPKLLNDAIDSFAENPGELDALCGKTLEIICNFQNTMYGPGNANSTEILDSLLTSVYGNDSEINIHEEAVKIASVLFSDSREEKSSSYQAASFLGNLSGRSSSQTLLEIKSGGDYQPAIARTNYFSDSNVESMYSQSIVDHELAVKAAEVFNTQDTFAFASSGGIRNDLSDYTWGTAAGNALMYDDVFNRRYDLENDLGLTGRDAWSMIANQVGTQLFGVQNNVENIATNYAIGRQQSYDGPANTNVANLALQATQNLGGDYQTALGYDYQAADASFYGDLKIDNYAAAYYGTKVAIAEWSIEAGEQAKEEALAEYTKYRAEKVEEEYGIKAEDYISFNTDDEIVRSRTELDWERAEKIIAPLVAIPAIPIAGASGLGTIVTSGVFSFYQGAAQKAQALELERTEISSNLDVDGKNIAALSMAEAMVYQSGETISYEDAYADALVEVESQAAGLKYQSNMMLASSAVSGLTSFSGIIKGAQALQGVQGFATRLSTVGRIGGMGLGSLTAKSAFDQGQFASANIEALDKELAVNDLSAIERQEKLEEIDDWKKSRTSSYVTAGISAGGVFGNAASATNDALKALKIRNPINGFTTWGDLAIDSFSLPMGVGVDAFNVSQSCFNPGAATDEEACRNAWVGLALGFAQDASQIKNSWQASVKYRNSKADYSQRINATEVAIEKVSKKLDGSTPSSRDTQKLTDLLGHYKTLVGDASREYPELKISQSSLATRLASESEVFVRNAAEVLSNALAAGGVPTDIVRNYTDSQKKIARISQDISNLDIRILVDNPGASSKLAAEGVDSLHQQRAEMVRQLEAEVKKVASIKKFDLGGSGSGSGEIDLVKLQDQNKQLLVDMTEGSLVLKIADRVAEQVKIADVEKVEKQKITPPDKDTVDDSDATKSPSKISIFIKDVGIAIKDSSGFVDTVKRNNQVKDLQKLAGKLGTNNLKITEQISEKRAKIEDLENRSHIIDQDSDTIKNLQKEIDDLLLTSNSALEGSKPLIKINREGENTRYEVTEAGDKVGLNQKQLSILNESLKSFEDYQRKETGIARWKIYSQANEAKNQDVFLLAEIEAFGIKGSQNRGIVFEALPGLGKTDVVIPFNVLLKQRLTGDPQFVVYSEAKLMKPWTTDGNYTPNKKFIDHVEKEFGKGSVLIVRPNDPNIKPADIKKAKFIITMKDIPFELQKTDTPIGMAMRTKWRESYVHGDEVQTTFKLDAIYKESKNNIPLTERQEYSLILDAQKKLLGIDETGSSIKSPNEISTLKALVYEARTGKTIPTAIDRTKDDSAGKFSSEGDGPDVERNVLMEWLGTWGGHKRVGLDPSEANLVKIREKIDSYLTNGDEGDIRQLRAERAVINETVTFLSRIPGEDYGLSNKNNVNSVAPYSESQKTGRSYSAVAEQLIYNTLGARTLGVKVDITKLTIGDSGIDTNFAKLMLESKGFSLYTGTPRSVAKLYEMAFGIKLKTFSVSAAEGVVNRFKDSPVGTTSKVFTSLKDQISARIKNRENQVFINMASGLRGNDSTRDEVVKTVVEQAKKLDVDPPKKLFLVGANGELQEYSITKVGKLEAIGPPFKDTDALNDRTKTLDDSGERYIKFYEHGAHVGVDTKNNVDISRAVGICNNCDETTFGQGINRVRLEVNVDPGTNATTVKYAPSDLVWLDAPSSNKNPSIDDFIVSAKSKQLANDAVEEVKFKEVLLRNSVDETIDALLSLARDGKEGFLFIGKYKPNQELVEQLILAKQRWKESSEMNYLSGSDDMIASVKLAKTAEQVKAAFVSLDKLLDGTGAPDKLLAKRADGALGSDDELIRVVFEGDEGYEILGETPSYRQIVDLINKSSKHLDDVVGVAFVDRSSPGSVIERQMDRAHEPVKKVVDTKVADVTDAVKDLTTLSVGMSNIINIPDIVRVLRGINFRVFPEYLSSLFEGDFVQKEVLELQQQETDLQENLTDDEDSLGSEIASTVWIFVDRWQELFGKEVVLSEPEGFLAEETNQETKLERAVDTKNEVADDKEQVIIEKTEAEAEIAAIIEKLGIVEDVSEVKEEEELIFEKHEFLETDDLQEIFSIVIEEARAINNKVGFKQGSGENNLWFVFDPNDNSLVPVGNKPRLSSLIREEFEEALLEEREEKMRLISLQEQKIIAADIIAKREFIITEFGISDTAEIENLETFTSIEELNLYLEAVTFNRIQELEEKMTEIEGNPGPDKTAAFTSLRALDKEVDRLEENLAKELLSNNEESSAAVIEVEDIFETARTVASNLRSLSFGASVSAVYGKGVTSLISLSEQIIAFVDELRTGQEDENLERGDASLGRNKEVLKKIINLTEKIYRNQAIIYETQPNLRKVDCGSNSCGLVSEISYYSSRSLGVPAFVYQVQDIHLKRGLKIEDSFLHAFSIVNIKGFSYVVDLTFGQFIDPNSLLVQENGEKLVGGRFNSDDYLVKQLMENGYFELTEDNFRHYLDITSNYSLPASVSALDLLNDTASLEIDVQPSEVDKWWPKTDVIEDIVKPQPQLQQKQPIQRTPFLNPAVGKSNVGKERDINQDIYFANGVFEYTDSNEKRKELPFSVDSNQLEKFGELALVLDGAGGMGGGEVASRTMGKWILEEFYNTKFHPELSVENGRIEERLKKVVEDAHYRFVSERIHYRAASTVVASVKLPQNKFVVAHVGDSRVYHFDKDGAIKFVTKDHSFGGSVLSRALGATDSEDPSKAEELFVDVVTISLNPGDSLLLETDGLNGMVGDEDIRHIMAESIGDEAKIDKLIEAALDAGGKDNITAVILKPEAEVEEEVLDSSSSQLPFGLLGTGASKTLLNMFIPFTPDIPRVVASLPQNMIQLFKAYFDSFISLSKNTIQTNIQNKNEDIILPHSKNYFKSNGDGSYTYVEVDATEKILLKWGKTYSSIGAGGVVVLTEGIDEWQVKKYNGIIELKSTTVKGKESIKFSTNLVSLNSWRALRIVSSFESLVSSSRLVRGFIEKQQQLKEAWTFAYYSPRNSVQELAKNLIAMPITKKNIFGFEVVNKKAVNRLVSDRDIIRDKYNLPNVELLQNSPNEYIKKIEQIAKENNIIIGKLHEFESFFKENPAVAAVHFGKNDGMPNTIVAGTVLERLALTSENYDEFLVKVERISKTDSQIYIDYAKSLTHELVHALQEEKYPGMTIEEQEYEAYLVADFALTKSESFNNKKTLEAVFLGISDSVRLWYENNDLKSDGRLKIRGIPDGVFDLTDKSESIIGLITGEKIIRDVGTMASRSPLIETAIFLRTKPDKDYDKFSFFVQVDKGAVSFGITTKIGDKEGKDFFAADLIARSISDFREQGVEIDYFDANWNHSDNPEVASNNYAGFLKALGISVDQDKREINLQLLKKSELEISEAIFSTWTGKLAQSLGFGEIVKKDVSVEKVKVTFKKTEEIPVIEVKKEVPTIMEVKETIELATLPELMTSIRNTNFGFIDPRNLVEAFRYFTELFSKEGWDSLKNEVREANKAVRNRREDGIFGITFSPKGSLPKKELEIDLAKDLEKLAYRDESGKKVLPAEAEAINFLYEVTNEEDRAIFQKAVGGLLPYIGNLRELSKAATDTDEELYTGWVEIMRAGRQAGAAGPRGVHSLIVSGLTESHLDETNPEDIIIKTVEQAKRIGKDGYRYFDENWKARKVSGINDPWIEFAMIDSRNSDKVETRSLLIRSSEIRDEALIILSESLLNRADGFTEEGFNEKIHSLVEGSNKIVWKDEAILEDRFSKIENKPISKMQSVGVMQIEEDTSRYDLDPEIVFSVGIKVDPDPNVFGDAIETVEFRFSHMPMNGIPALQEVANRIVFAPLPKDLTEVKNTNPISSGELTSMSVTPRILGKTFKERGPLFKTSVREIINKIPIADEYIVTYKIPEYLSFLNYQNRTIADLSNNLLGLSLTSQETDKQVGVNFGKPVVTAMAGLSTTKNGKAVFAVAAGDKDLGLVPSGTSDSFEIVGITRKIALELYKEVNIRGNYLNSGIRGEIFLKILEEERSNLARAQKKSSWLAGILDEEFDRAKNDKSSPTVLAKTLGSFRKFIEFSSKFIIPKIIDVVRIVAGQVSVLGGSLPTNLSGANVTFVSSNTDIAKDAMGVLKNTATNRVSTDDPNLFLKVFLSIAKNKGYYFLYPEFMRFLFGEASKDAGVSVKQVRDISNLSAEQHERFANSATKILTDYMTSNTAKYRKIVNLPDKGELSKLIPSVMLATVMTDSESTLISMESYRLGLLLADPRLDIVALRKQVLDENPGTREDGTKIKQPIYDILYNLGKRIDGNEERVGDSEILRTVDMSNWSSFVRRVPDKLEPERGGEAKEEGQTIELESKTTVIQEKIELLQSQFAKIDYLEQQNLYFYENASPDEKRRIALKLIDFINQETSFSEQYSPFGQLTDLFGLGDIGNVLQQHDVTTGVNKGDVTSWGALVPSWRAMSRKIMNIDLLVIDPSEILASHVMFGRMPHRTVEFIHELAHVMQDPKGKIENFFRGIFAGFSKDNEYVAREIHAYYFGYSDGNQDTRLDSLDSTSYRQNLNSIRTRHIINHENVKVLDKQEAELMSDYGLRAIDELLALGVSSYEIGSYFSRPGLFIDEKFVNIEKKLEEHREQTGISDQELQTAIDEMYLREFHDRLVVTIKSQEILNDWCESNGFVYKPPFRSKAGLKRSEE